MKNIKIIWTGQEKEVVKSETLATDGGSLRLVQILIGSGTESLNLKTNVSHLAKNTTSEVIIRGVLKDKAVVTSDNLIKIQKGAKGANAYLSAKILVFDDAKGVVTPSLEIDENEVKAGHGASVGQINEEELFYLQSRGLSEEESKRLIVEGFFEEVLRDLPIPEQKKVRGIIKEKLC